MHSVRNVSVFSDDRSYLNRILDTLPNGRNFNLIDWPEIEKAKGKSSPETPVEATGLSKNILVLATASELPHLASFLHATNRRHHLSALLVRDDEPEWIPQLLSRANVRALRNMLVVHGEDIEVTRRVLLAWALDAADQLIADARVVDDRLLVVSCAMNQTELPFDAIPALSRLPEEDRPQFKVAKDGSYLRWPTSDVDLDLEAIRYYTDDNYRQRANRERLMRDEQFGASVAAVRKRYELRQTDVEGLSARQVRRVEKGKSASLAALEKLARAHGLETNEYLEEIAREIGSIS